MDNFMNNITDSRFFTAKSFRSKKGRYTDGKLCLNVDICPSLQEIKA